MNSQPSKLLRDFVNEDDRYGGKLLYEAILGRCRDLKIAGAAVFSVLSKGLAKRRSLHHQHLFCNDQPIVITIVERPEKADQILPVIQDMMNGGIIAVTDVEVPIVSKGARPTLP